MKPPLYQRVDLLRDLDEHRLKKGDVAVMIDRVPHPAGREEGVILEIFDLLGESLAVVAVPESAIKHRPTRFMGLVDALLGTPDETKRVSGEVELRMLEGGPNLRLKLDADDYQVASDAHHRVEWVSLKGILYHDEPLDRIESVSNFGIMTD